MADKEATVFIIDVGRSMGKTTHYRDVTDLDWSLRWLWDRLTNIVSLGRKTLFVGVIALGSDTTNNSMQEDASYKHINVLQPITTMAMPELKALSPNIEPSATDHRDAMSAIILAVDMIMRHCKHLKFKKRIYLITNGTGAMDPDDIDSIAEQIKQNAIDLTVLGVDFDDPEYGFKEEDKPTMKMKNEKLLKNLVGKCGGVFGTMQEAIENLAIPSIKPVRPTPTYKGQLRLGDPTNYDTAITIDIERYFKVAVRRPPTASSFAVRDSSQTDDGLVPVQTSRVYIVPDADAPQNEKSLDPEELARGYQYGRTAVPITQSDENITKLETDAGYELLGFIPKENVERYMILENTNMLVAQKSNDKAAFALSSLIHALFEIDSCAIGRLVKKDMAEPHLTLLTPYADDEVECLIENIIPFAEDLRQYRFPPVDKILTVSGKHLQSHRNLPDDSLTSAMSSFVDDMTINNDEYMRIEDIYSPVLHTIEGAIRYRAVHPDVGLPSVSEHLLAPSKQPRELQERSRKSMRNLVRAAEVKKVPPKVKGRKRVRETEKPLSGLDISALFRDENRVKISPDNAIPEFKQIVDTSVDIKAVYDAATQLELIIADQIRHSFGDRNYERIVEEIGVMRDELRQLEEFDCWHEKIRGLKEKILSDELGGNRRELWWRIRMSKLGLIDCTEETNSPITKEEAEEFLSSR